MLDENTKERYLAEFNELFEQRRPYVIENYPQIRDIYQNGYQGDTELNPLRNEISICLVFGLCQASITLTNHMLEKFLKLALVYKNVQFEDGGDHSVQHLADKFRPLMDKYSKNDLGKNINLACSQGIISKKDKKTLKEIRDKLRNAYSHADISKIHGGARIQGAGFRFTENGLQGEKPSFQEIYSLPFVQGIMQAKLAEAQAIPYFKFVDALIRKTLPGSGAKDPTTKA